MTDENKNRQLRVGIFLAIGLFAVLVSIILLGGDRALFKKHVVMYAKLNQVQGLDRGSIVSFAGLTIGNVKSIGFSEEQKSLVVTIKIQEEYLNRLNKGVLADVRTQGALGDKYIYISPGEANDPPLKEGDFIPTSTTGDLMGIISEKGGEAVKIFDIINEVYKLTKIINAEGRSEKLMVNFVETSHNLKETSAEAKKLLSELRGQNTAKFKESIEHLNSVLSKIDKGEGSLGLLINDPSVHERLKALLGADARKQSIKSLIRTSIEKSDKN